MENNVTKVEIYFLNDCDLFNLLSARAKKLEVSLSSVIVYSLRKYYKIL